MNSGGVDAPVLWGYLDGRFGGPNPEKSPIFRVSHLDNAFAAPAARSGW